jgi:hypothetical protein
MDLIFPMSAAAIFIFVIMSGFVRRSTRTAMAAIIAVIFAVYMTGLFPMSLFTGTPAEITEDTVISNGQQQTIKKSTNEQIDSDWSEFGLKLFIFIAGVAVIGTVLFLSWKKDQNERLISKVKRKVSRKRRRH